jgi:hypothetical protein
MFHIDLPRTCKVNLLGIDFVSFCRLVRLQPIPASRSQTCRRHGGEESTTVAQHSGVQIDVDETCTRRPTPAAATKGDEPSPSPSAPLRASWCWSPCYTLQCGELAWGATEETIEAPPGERRSPHRANTPSYSYRCLSRRATPQRRMNPSIYMARGGFG